MSDDLKQMGYRLRQRTVEPDQPGRIKFDEKGQAHPPVYVTQWCANGTRRILYPEKLKADCGAG